MNGLTWYLVSDDWFLPSPCFQSSFEWMQGVSVPRYFYSRITSVERTINPLLVSRCIFRSFLFLVTLNNLAVCISVQAFVWTMLAATFSVVTITISLSRTHSRSYSLHPTGQVLFQSKKKWPSKKVWVSRQINADGFQTVDRPTDGHRYLVLKRVERNFPPP